MTSAQISAPFRKACGVESRNWSKHMRTGVIEKLDDQYPA
jgi:hypothetical protein